MPSRKPAAVPDDVDAFLAALDHPYKKEIVALRRILLGVDPAVGESIQWKVPSFRTSEYFATLHLRAKDGIGVILHFGTKKRPGFAPRSGIADPDGLLQWLAKDRAMVVFRDAKDIAARRAAFTNVLRQWIRHV